MNKLLISGYVASLVVLIFGRLSDYRSSLGQNEVNGLFHNEQGKFRGNRYLVVTRAIAAAFNIIIWVIVSKTIDHGGSSYLLIAISYNASQGAWSYWVDARHNYRVTGRS